MHFWYAPSTKSKKRQPAWGNLGAGVGTYGLGKVSDLGTTQIWSFCFKTTNFFGCYLRTNLSQIGHPKLPHGQPMVYFRDTNDKLLGPSSISRQTHHL